MLAKCSIELYGPQMFVMPRAGRRGYIRSDESTCLDVSSATEYSVVFLIACSSLSRQHWLLEPDTGRIVHANSKLCLTLERRGIFGQLRKCKPTLSTTAKRQQWTIADRVWAEPLAELPVIN